jgi:peptidoglycan-N-acetylglucosamine deacetylase
MNGAPRRIEIPQFPQAKRIAVTLSWDDGLVADRRLVAAMNEWGLKGTFNLNSSLLEGPGKAAPVDRWQEHVRRDEVASLYAGHEVAIHTLTHPHLEKLDASQVVEEVLRDRQNLEDLVGYPVRGAAYPFGSYNAQVISILRDLGIVYCRTCANTDRPWPVAEPLLLASTGHVFNCNPLSIPERFEKACQDPGYSGLFYVWGHSYEFDRPGGHTWDDLPRFIKPLGGKPDVWYCTNIELFDYEAARQRLVIAANRRSAHNPSAIAVTLLVDGKTVEVPGGKTLSLVG